jgi:hypothetical protein
MTHDTRDRKITPPWHSWFATKWWEKAGGGGTATATGTGGSGVTTTAIIVVVVGDDNDNDDRYVYSFSMGNTRPIPSKAAYKVGESG